LAYWQLIIAEGTYLGSRVVARTYDWIARRYDGIKQFNPRDESWFVAGPLLQALAGVEQPLVLDVATGTGRLPLALMRERFASAGGRVVGLDLSRGMLRQARAKLLSYRPQVDLVWQDACCLPFDDGTFDAVTCLESLEFMPQPREALAEMVRVLAPGGVLLVTNRVGREARFLPRRAMRRPAFEAALVALALRDVQVRPWQVDYDLALARKEGPGRAAGQGDASLADLLRCPRCQGGLKQAVSSLTCPACGLLFPVREGIVHMADLKKRGES
ncbi:MAG: methyltransferase domain-containing protein, partial [Anaerolineae bacterium]